MASKKLAPYQDPSSAYSKSMKAGTLGMGFGGPSKMMKSKPSKMMKFNSGGNYTKAHKKAFGL